MKCPACGGAELIPGSKKAMPFVWQGCEIALEGQGDLCPLCGEFVLSDESWRQLDEKIKNFKKISTRDSGAYIRAIRKKRALSQKEA